jgi:uncharacterized protein
MSRDTIGGIKKLIEHRSNELSLLDIGWFGGEPLLAQDIIEEINLSAIESMKINPESTIISSISTNATLLSRYKLEELIKCGVSSFHISLDGNKDHHDTTRISRNKEGTFDKIWGNLLSIKESQSNFSIVLRVHLTYSNYFSVAKLINEIKTEFYEDHRFCVYFKAIKPLGGEVKHLLGHKEFLRQQDQLTSLLSKTKLLKPHKKSDEICYASRANSFVIRANGSLGKCTVALHDENNDIGKINPDGTLSVIQDKLSPWIAGITNDSKNYAACPKMAIERKTL